MEKTLQVEVETDKFICYQVNVRKIEEDGIYVDFPDRDSCAENQQNSTRFDFNQVRLPLKDCSNENQNYKLGDLVQVLSTSENEPLEGWHRARIEIIKDENFYVQFLDRDGGDLVQKDIIQPYHFNECFRCLTVPVSEDILEICQEQDSHKDLIKHSGVMDVIYSQQKEALVLVCPNSEVENKCKLLKEEHLKSLKRKAKQLKLQRAHKQQFSVPDSLVGLALGVNGKNIKKAEQIEGILSIQKTNHRKKCVFKIIGETEDAVTKARSILEFTQEIITVPKTLAGKLEGRKSETIHEILERSQVHKITIQPKVDIDETQFIIIGLLEKVETAKILINYKLDEIKDLEEYKKRLDEKRKSDADQALETRSKGRGQDYQGSEIRGRFSRSENSRNNFNRDNNNKQEKSNGNRGRGGGRSRGPFHQTSQREATKGSRIQNKDFSRTKSPIHQGQFQNVETKNSSEEGANFTTCSEIDKSKEDKISLNYSKHGRGLNHSVISGSGREQESLAMGKIKTPSDSKTLSETKTKKTRNQLFDEIDEDKILKCIVSKYDGIVSTGVFVCCESRLFPNVHPIEWITERGKRFHIYREDSDVAYIAAFYKELNVCKHFFNPSKPSTCENDSCPYFHICKNFVRGNCRKRRCTLPHDLSGLVNTKIKEQYGLEDYTDNDIITLLNWKYPRLCSDYIYTKQGCQLQEFPGCTTDASDYYLPLCPYLHYCRDYFFGKCSAGDECSYKHSFLTPHNLWVLSSCHVNNQSEDALKRMVFVPPEKNRAEKELDQRGANTSVQESISVETIGCAKDVPPLQGKEKMLSSKTREKITENEGKLSAFKRTNTASSISKTSERFQNEQKESAVSRKGDEASSDYTKGKEKYQISKYRNNASSPVAMVTAAKEESSMVKRNRKETCEYESTSLSEKASSMSIKKNEQSSPVSIVTAVIDESSIVKSNRKYTCKNDSKSTTETAPNMSIKKNEQSSPVSMVTAVNDESSIVKRNRKETCENESTSLSEKAPSMSINKNETSSIVAIVRSSEDGMSHVDRNTKESSENDMTSSTLKAPCLTIQRNEGVPDTYKRNVEALHVNEMEVEPSCSVEDVKEELVKSKSKSQEDSVGFVKDHLRAQNSSNSVKRFQGSRLGIRNKLSLKELQKIYSLKVRKARPNPLMVKTKNETSEMIDKLSTATDEHLETSSVVTDVKPISSLNTTCKRPKTSSNITDKTPATYSNVNDKIPDALLPARLDASSSVTNIGPDALSTITKMRPFASSIVTNKGPDGSSTITKRRPDASSTVTNIRQDAPSTVMSMRPDMTKMRPHVSSTVTNMRPHVSSTVTNMRPDTSSSVTNLRPDTSSSVTNLTTDASSTVTNVRSDASSTVTNVRSDASSTVTNLRPDSSSTMTNLRPDDSSSVTNLTTDASSTVTNMRPDDSSTMTNLRSDTSSSVTNLTTDASSTVTNMRPDDSSTMTNLRSDTSSSVTNLTTDASSTVTNETDYGLETTFLTVTITKDVPGRRPKNRFGNSTDIMEQNEYGLHNAQTLVKPATKNDSVKLEHFECSEVTCGKKYICTQLTKAYCHNTVCSDLHLREPVPFLWQYEDLNGHWMTFSSDSNFRIEQSYCGLETSVNFKDYLQNKEHQVILQFDKHTNHKATLIPVEGHTRKVKVRRLSTRSFTEVSMNEDSYITQWRWYWKDNDELFKPYDNDLKHYTLEIKYLGKQEEYLFSRENYQQKYKLTFKTMEQQNVGYSTTRAIMRRPLFVSELDIKQKQFPKRITSSAIDLYGPQPRPEYFDPWDLAHDFELIELKPGEEYHRVQRSFDSTMAMIDVEINSIYRIQNRKLWSEYLAFKKHMHADGERDNPNFMSVDERNLFHGTDSLDTCRGICTNNFDFRKSGKNATVYGEGSYFAKNASYSHNYTRATATGDRYMFRAKVLVGNFTPGSSGLRRPPEIPGQSHKLYDSCVDVMLSPSIFVIFERSQSYPEYLVVYKDSERDRFNSYGQSSYSHGISSTSHTTTNPHSHSSAYPSNQKNKSSCTVS